MAREVRGRSSSCLTSCEKAKQWLCYSEADNGPSQQIPWLSEDLRDSSTLGV